MAERPHEALPLRLGLRLLGGSMLFGALALAWASSLRSSTVLWGALAVALLPLLVGALRGGYALAVRAPTMAGLMLSFAFLTVRAPETTWYELAGAAYFFLALLWWLYARAVSREHVLLRDPLDLCLAFFVGWSLLSAAWGMQSGTATDVLADVTCMLCLLYTSPSPRD